MTKKSSATNKAFIIWSPWGSGMVSVLEASLPLTQGIPSSTLQYLRALLVLCHLAGIPDLCTCACTHKHTHTHTCACAHTHNQSSFLKLSKKEKIQKNWKLKKSLFGWSKNFSYSDEISYTCKWLLFNNYDIIYSLMFAAMYIYIYIYIYTQTHI